jgi:DNA-binding MarR family transcriptional regulator
VGEAVPVPRLSNRIKRLYLLLSRFVDDSLKPYGLARGQWQVLAHVHQAGTLSQRRLQESMKIESATLTVIIDLLVTKGWLERLPDPADKRVRLLRFTPDGLERWHDVPDPIALAEERMLAGLDATERSVVADAVERMIAGFEIERKVQHVPHRTSEGQDQAIRP